MGILFTVANYPHIILNQYQEAYVRSQYIQLRRKKKIRLMLFHIMRKLSAYRVVYIQDQTVVSVLSARGNHALQLRSDSFSIVNCQADWVLVIYCPKLQTQHHITLIFSKNKKTLRKTQPVHCFVSFFQHLILPPNN